MTAWSKDFLDTMKANLPFVFGFVLALAFVLLLATRRPAGAAVFGRRRPVRQVNGLPPTGRP